MIFAVTNQKGGVGKTTTVLNLATYVALKGKKVLVLDCDPQSNLSSGLGVFKKSDDEFPDRTEEKTIYDVLVNKVSIQEIVRESKIKNLFVAPASIELAGAEVELVSFLSRENVLKRALEDVKKEYDFIFIDCPPSLGLLTINSLVAADFALIPVQAEYFALEGLGQLINTINLIKGSINPNLDVGGVIITMFDTRTNLSKDVAAELEKFFSKKVFKTNIPRNIRLSESPSHAQSIQEFAPTSTGAKAYESLAEEILERFN